MIGKGKSNVWEVMVDITCTRPMSFHITCMTVILMVDTMNANCSKFQKSWVHHMLSHITYMGNLHVFNHYKVEAFTYHTLLELCVNTIDVMPIVDMQNQNNFKLGLRSYLQSKLMLITCC